MQVGSRGSGRRFAVAVRTGGWNARQIPGNGTAGAELIRGGTAGGDAGPVRRADDPRPYRRFFGSLETAIAPEVTPAAH